MVVVVIVIVIVVVAVVVVGRVVGARLETAGRLVAAVGETR